MLDEARATIAGFPPSTDEWTALPYGRADQPGEGTRRCISCLGDVRDMERRTDSPADALSKDTDSPALAI